MHPTPGKIICIGRNYVAHAKELGNEVPAAPLLFLKPPSAVIGSGADIVLPPASADVQFEGEIGVVIGRVLRHVTAEVAREALRGICAANDVTARDLQRADGQWTRAKGFDTFCPLGPEVAVPTDLDTLEVVTRVNGVERQRGRANEMAVSIPQLVAYISGIMTLAPGDVVLTGTPAGVGPLAVGDVVEVDVGAGASRVSNPVVAERG